MNIPSYTSVSIRDELEVWSGGGEYLGELFGIEVVAYSRDGLS